MIMLKELSIRGYCHDHDILHDKLGIHHTGRAIMSLYNHDPCSIKCEKNIDIEIKINKNIIENM